MRLQDKLVRLRAQAGLSQEKLAAEMEVSRQTVQKWESGAATPEIEKLTRLARRFGVSLDALLLDGDRRGGEEMRGDTLIQPEYAAMHEWESYAACLPTEFRQCMEEGKDVGAYEGLFREVARMPAGPLKTRMADILFELTQRTPQRKDYPFDESSDLQEIQALRPAAQPGRRPRPENAEMADRLMGAWLGRIAGCLLGKPIEGIRTEELHPLLQETGNWPLRRYILASDLTTEMLRKYTFRLKGKCWADSIPCAPSDDDTNYTVMAQKLLEECGRDFSPADVARLWLDKQPKKAYCTAERVTYCNLIKGYLPTASARFQNPFREWIGAQIRGDYFGYINPGDPETAAEMAWRDACISHTKNGIYGEMMIAAMLAQAAVEKDISVIIRAGLSQIPASSRLYQAVEKTLLAWGQGESCQACFAGIHRDYDEHNAHDWCHTISNARIVTAALLYGQGAYGKSICLAVQTGFDTDCNGATVGSILGMRGGAGCIEPEWIAPLHGQLDTSIFGVGRVKIADLAAKTMEHLPR